MKSLLAAFAILLSITVTASAQTVDDGWNAYDAGDYEKAKSIFLPLAEAGNAKAMNAVGLMYSEGKAYPKDRKTACDWYEKSASNEYPAAKHNLSSCYFEASGREADEAKALYWEEKAAKSGYLLSQIQLFRTYKDTNPEKAKFWGEKAADAGSTMARVGLWAEFQDQYERPPFSDIVCIMGKIVILRQNWTSCD